MQALVQLRVILLPHELVHAPATDVSVVRIGCMIAHLDVEAPGATLSEVIPIKIGARDAQTGELPSSMGTKLHISGYVLLFLELLTKVGIDAEVRVAEGLNQSVIRWISWPGSTWRPFNC